MGLPPRNLRSVLPSKGVNPYKSHRPMSIQPQALAEATFTILPDPITGEAVFLRDGVVIQTFKTLQEAFDFGYRYVNAPFLPKTTEEWISTANSKVK